MHFSRREPTMLVGPEKRRGMCGRAARQGLYLFAADGTSIEPGTYLARDLSSLLSLPPAKQGLLRLGSGWIAAWRLWNRHYWVGGVVEWMGGWADLQDLFCLAFLGHDGQMSRAQGPSHIIRTVNLVLFSSVRFL